MLLFTDKLNRTVVVNVVVKEKYIAQYEDPTSSEYKEFVGNFIDQMVIYYQGKNIENFKGVMVTSVSPGDPLVRHSHNAVEEMRSWDGDMAIYSVTPTAESVKVTHDVVLEVLNDASSVEQYGQDFQAITEAVGNLVGCIERVFEGVPGVLEGILGVLKGVPGSLRGFSGFWKGFRGP
ncbi:uncharacterized protein LOC144543549 [Centroberyx gerrardi]